MDNRIFSGAGVLAASVLAFLGVSIAIDTWGKPTLPSSPSPGGDAGGPVPDMSTPAASPAPPQGRGFLGAGDFLTVFPGFTYFAAVEVNGTAFAVSTVDRVTAYARGQGFVDVVVFKKGEQPTSWPIHSVGDYIVRATLAGMQGKRFPRRNNLGIKGSVNILEAFEA